MLPHMPLPMGVLEQLQHHDRAVSSHTRASATLCMQTWNYTTDPRGHVAQTLILLSFQPRSAGAQMLGTHHPSEQEVTPPQHLNQPHATLSCPVPSIDPFLGKMR